MMIVVDTSVWVDHLRRGNDELAALLNEGAVLCHPLVIGELACGNLTNRNELLGLLSALPRARMAEHDEVLHLLSSRRLYGRGLGWIDVHLLASALMSKCPLWTLDNALKQAARSLKITVS
jgi:predicted nucleic acid-binding protein